MPKEWDDYDPYKQHKKSKELAEQYGVDYDQFQEEDRGSQGNFDQDGFNDAISKAMANDYDTRRALEAARLSGDYDGPQGISNLSEGYAAHNFLKDTHEANGGGRFSSANDYANVTTHFVDKDRDGLMTDIQGMKDKLLDDAFSQKEEDEAEEEPYVESERLSGASSRLEAAANNPTSLYDKNNESAPTSNDQEQGALNFFDQTKKNLAQGFNLQEDIANNLNNAANYSGSFGSG